VTRRLLFTVAFLGLMAALTRWTRWFDWVELHTSYEGAWLSLGAAAMLVGVVEGRWWVLPLPALTWLVVWTPGMDPEARAYLFVLGIPVTFAGLLVGVAGRAWWRAAKRGRERRLHLADHS
jgi:hypothetical protein